MTTVLQRASGIEQAFEQTTPLPLPGWFADHVRHLTEFTQTPFGLPDVLALR